MLINLVLALFNLIPAFPMDGGRVLRALLAMRIEYTRATQIAATLGQGMALLFGLVGLFTNPFLLFIAFFVWIGAAQEVQHDPDENVAQRHPRQPRHAHRLPHPLPARPALAPGGAAPRRLAARFPGGERRPGGGHPHPQRPGALAQHRRRDDVRRRAMQKTFAVINSSQMLEAIAQRPDLAAQGIIPVVHNASLVGLVTMENIGEFLMIQKALQARRTQP